MVERRMVALFASMMLHLRRSLEAWPLVFGTDGAPHQELFARWAIRCALLPVDSPIHKQLQDARWRPLHLDDQFVVMGRP